jgi:Nucleotidyl transferase AbiEii toxin, Type IV TA system
VNPRYRDAVALRRALEDRLRQDATDDAHDLTRRRRLVVFDRLAARLSADPEGGWVLKGGAVLEFRLRDRARMTKDLDLATRSEGLNGEDVREQLIEALAADVDGDGFVFRVASPTPLAADSAGRPAWRYSVEAHLAGKLFAGIRLDVAARGEELAGTEMLPLPNTLAFAGLPTRSIEAVDRRQHFAEKLHALTRDYGARPNTRVKDLVDLILLIESPLAPDSSLVATVRHVFTVRATHLVPTRIESPPASWEASYPETALGLTRTTPELAKALTTLQAFWVTALTAAQETDH